MFVCDLCLTYNVLVTNNFDHIIAFELYLAKHYPNNNPFKILTVTR